MSVQKNTVTASAVSADTARFLTNALKVNNYLILNLTTKQYIEYCDANGTIVPDFQRPEVWDGADEKSGLLTIKNGQPFPTIIIGVCVDKFGATCGSFIIDGQQRTKMIRDLVKKFAPLPLTIQTIMDYVWTIQVVKGTAEQLQELYVRVNSKSGLTPCQKIEGTFRGDVKEIKNAFKLSKQIKALYTRTTKVAFEDLPKTAEDKPDYMEVLVSGKVSDVAVFLTVAEISQFSATTKSVEVTKFVSGISSIADMPKHIKNIDRKLQVLYSVLSDEIISKAVKNNLAYTVAVYCLAHKRTALEIIDGLHLLFQADGTRRCTTDVIALTDKDGQPLGKSTPVDDEMLFGKGSDNGREATARKIAFIDNLIDRAKLNAMKTGNAELSEEEEALMNKTVKG
jgi:hypothetical protein